MLKEEKGGLEMFNNVNQEVSVDAVSWKESYPSFTMDVKKVSIEKEYGGGNADILLESSEGMKFKSYIVNDLKGLIIEDKKYRIWYQYQHYPSGLRKESTEIVCVEEIGKV